MVAACNSQPVPSSTLPTELPIIESTITPSRTFELTPTSTITPIPPPTLAPTWTPEPTFTPFVLPTLQKNIPLANSGCSWMKNIEGKWVPDIWDQIFTFYPNGEYSQLDKLLVDYADTMSIRGKYECTSEGYLRILLDGEEVFETSIVKVNIIGNNMDWTFVDDNDSDGHGQDFTLSFVKK